MTEYISRKDVLAVFGDVHPMDYNANAYIEKIKAISAANVVERNQWIPVTERLPEDSVQVLTCDDKGNIHIFSHYHLFENPFAINPTNPRYYMVKWWMPLPEPPKDGAKHEGQVD